MRYSRSQFYVQITWLRAKKYFLQPWPCVVYFCKIDVGNPLNLYSFLIGLSHRKEGINAKSEYSRNHSNPSIFNMKTFLILSLVVSLLPYISNGRRKQRKVVFTEEEILSSTSSRKGLPRRRIKNPDFYGQLPNQVFVVVSIEK